MSRSKKEVLEHLEDVDVCDVPEECIQCLMENGEDVLCWDVAPCAMCDSPPFERCEHCEADGC